MHANPTTSAMPPAVDRPGPDWRFAWVLTAAFALLGVAMQGRHEMFRDEIQAWLIARDLGVGDLLRYLRYEGHPTLWYLCLKVLVPFTDSPRAMQSLHLLIISAAVWVGAAFAPCSRPLKVLAAFGYFFAFEYSVIARNYALGVLLGFAFCALYGRRAVRPLWMAVVLALMANTSAHALVVAVTAMAALVWEQIQRPLGTSTPARRGRILAVAIMAAGVAFAFWTLRPPPDGGYAAEWHTELDPHRAALVVSQLANAFLPMPDWQHHFWNSNILYQLPHDGVVRVGLAAGILLAAVLALAATPAALVLFLFSVAGLDLLFYTKYIGYLRHHGFLYVAFLMALWIRPSCTRVAWSWGRHAGAVARVARCGRWLFSGVLLLQVGAAIVALALDAVLPWSPAGQVTDYLRTHRQSRLVVGLSDWQASVVAGPLGREPIYFPRGRRFGTYVRLDRTQLLFVEDTDAVFNGMAVAHARGQDGLFVVSYPLQDIALAWGGLRLLAMYPEGVVPGEVFYLYETRQAGTPPRRTAVQGR
jgi:hypothetical protein